MNLNTTDFNTIEAYLKSTDKSESIITLHNTLIAFNRMKIFTGRLTEAKELPYDRENLSNAVYSTLTKLHDLGESNMGKLSEVLGFTASKTTRCVDALIKKGFAERRYDENNRRIVIVRPTEKGFALTEENNLVIMENFRNLLKKIPEKELDEMLSAYAAIVRIYHDYCELFLTVGEYKKKNPFDEGSSEND